MRLSFASRASALARSQTAWVIREMQRCWPGLECEERLVITQGDRVLDRPLPEIGGKGLFTRELEAELLEGRLQVAVHSLKDLLVNETIGLAIGAIPSRADARDALISSAGVGLIHLPEGARVGTSSPRRAAQLLSLRPDLHIKPLRGNLDTRVRKALAGDFDAVVVAAAGLIRLGLEGHITEWLSLERVLPAPGQGALAVQCRSDDGETRRLLAAIEHSDTRTATNAERAFLDGLGGGCAVPVAAFAEIRAGGGTPTIELFGLVSSLDGKKSVRVHGSGNDPKALGAKMAKLALKQGAGEILAVAGGVA